MRHRLGSLDAFPEGGCTVVQVGRRSVGVFNVDGRLYAVRNSCPHHGAPICMGQFGGTMLPSAPGELSYGMENKVLRCPWHGWEYSIEDGSSVGGIDRSRQVTYPVSIEGDDVVIEAKGL
jgi:3-phenylpropionate/trans-cinnamate dioxygenase ferredoxin subunit